MILKKCNNYYNDEIIESKIEEKYLDYNNLTYGQSLKLDEIRSFYTKSKFNLSEIPYKESELNYIYDLFVNNICEKNPPIERCFDYILYYDNVAIKNKMNCDEHPEIKHYVNKISNNINYIPLLLKFYFMKDENWECTIYIAFKIFEFIIKCIIHEAEIQCSIISLRLNTIAINDIYNRLDTTFDHYYTKLIYSYYEFDNKDLKFYQSAYKTSIILKNKKAEQFFSNKISTIRKNTKIHIY